MVSYKWVARAVAIASCFLTVLSDDKTETGAEYLQSVINQLQSERDPPQLTYTMGHDPVVHDNDENFKIMGPTPLPPHTDHEVNAQATNQMADVNNDFPSAPQLSKEELSALYQAAVNKGSTIDLSSLLNNPSEALQNIVSSGAAPAGEEGTVPGYYYYFYPINSFTKDEDAAKNNVVDSNQSPAPATPAHFLTKPQMAQMVPTAMMLLDNPSHDKSVEPLFMAMSSFIGMALMFIFSVLFMPKFGTLRSRGISALKHAPEELSTLTKLVLEAIDGKDCSERIACEVGRAARKMKLDNKPLRILEILLPVSLSKQLQMVRKSAAKREKCSFIPCKWKSIMKA